MKQNEKGDTHQESKNTIEWSQGVANGEWSDAKAVMDEEANASNKKGDGGGDSPGKAALNHEA